MAEHLPQHSAAAFVAIRNFEDIAKQLRVDVALVNKDLLCSWVALHTPPSGTLEALEIARHLTPSPDFSDNIKLMLYESMVSRIRIHLNHNGVYVAQHEVDAACQRLQGTRVEPYRISSARIYATLEVLDSLLEHMVLDPELPLRRVMASLQRMMAAQDENMKNVNEVDICTSSTPEIGSSEPPILPRKRLCYICRLSLTVPHPTQPSMCTPCGAFNLASSHISTPSALILQPKFTALVTGARINLGYHTTLRLLRCGARVLATTRYPKDAMARYVQENDYPEWKTRLRILGADFRSASDVFALVRDTRRCLRDWGGAEKLQLLINNAAQTLTDSVREEERAIEREAGLTQLADTSRMYVSGTYTPRVRGGGSLMALGGVDKERGLIENANIDLDTCSTAAHDTIEMYSDREMVKTYSKSSWVQSLFEIPYEDVISTHSVNTFVPLILCRELLPLMGKQGAPSEEAKGQPASTKPEAYIINVSSREGIFEHQTRSIGKAGKHVHTNMSKAALNMITETEGASAWHLRRVAMNTVDPGYMSAAPEYEGSFDGKRPLGWEDGAGRVLWPVAIGELEGKAIWGRFLKHYGAVEVDPGAGRG
ncbi:hypothetical protein SVAN01_03501 [Stagonosporopsis vannaccii]|nr:hypothetical protein SVAN01_03501 [Stagonosporopsis vannaccii]